MGPCTVFRSQFFLHLNHPVAHALFYVLLPPLLCAVVVSLSPPLSISAGDEDRTTEHDINVLRDLESTRAVCALGNSRVAFTQCDIGTCQERRPGPAHQHIRWGWRTVLPAHGKVKVRTCLEVAGHVSSYA